jgi:hypothetical protein
MRVSLIRTLYWQRRIESLVSQEHAKWASVQQLKPEIIPR